MDAGVVGASHAVDTGKDTHLVGKDEAVGASYLHAVERGLHQEVYPWVAGRRAMLLIDAAGICPHGEDTLVGACKGEGIVHVGNAVGVGLFRMPTG